MSNFILSAVYDFNPFSMKSTAKQNSLNKTVHRIELCLFSHYMPCFNTKIDYFLVAGLSNCNMGGPFQKPTILASC